MRRALHHSQSEVQQLIQANKNLQLEVERLNNMVIMIFFESLFSWYVYCNKVKHQVYSESTLEYIKLSCNVATMFETW